MSRAASPGEIIATGPLAGGLDYLAPEQIEGDALGGAADLYSLACTGFELLCGTPPFGQDQGLTVLYAQLYAPPPPAAERRPDLPAAVDNVLARALAKDPADRYASCGEFAEELRAALGIPSGASRASRSGPGIPRGPVVVGAGAGTPRPPEAGPGAARAPAVGPDQDPDGHGGSGGADRDRPRRFSAVRILVLAAIVAAIGSRRHRSGHVGPVEGGPADCDLARCRLGSASFIGASFIGARIAPACCGASSGLAAGGRGEQSAGLQRSDPEGAAARSQPGQICGTDLSSAASVIQDVVNQRSAQYDQASALPVSLCPAARR